MKPSKKGFKELYSLIIAESPTKADIIIWLQGDRYDRGAKVLKLYKQEWGQKIILSGNNVLIGRGLRPGENNVSLGKMKNFLIKRGVRKKDLIIDNGGMNTKEQSEHILKIAKIKKWKDMILVASSYYQPRAFLTFLKQAKKTKWSGRLINQAAIIGWNNKPAGRSMSARLLFEEEFEKIKRYKKDLATIKQGIAFLNKLK